MADDVPRVEVVVHDQDGDAVEARQGRGRRLG
jgi:hypothetical protein